MIACNDVEWGTVNFALSFDTIFLILIHITLVGVGQLLMSNLLRNDDKQTWAGRPVERLYASHCLVCQMQGYSPLCRIHHPFCILYVVTYPLWYTTLCSHTCGVHNATELPSSKGKIGRQGDR